MSTGSKLSSRYLENHPADAARALEGLPLEQAAELLETAPFKASSSTLERMEPAWSALLLRRFTPQRAGEILEGLNPQSAVQLLRTLAAEEREQLLGGTPSATATRLRRLLTYPEDSAGRLMDPLVMALPDDIDAGEAVRRLRRYSPRVRYYLYLTDPGHRLVGVLTLRELMATPPGDRLVPRYQRPVTRLDVKDNRSTILQHPGWLKYHALPVTDGAGVLAGVLRYETLRRLEGETADERPADLISLGSALGEAWVGISALLFDGFAGSLHQSRSIAAARGKEEPDGT